MNNQVVVRFAPSPTGYLHIGGVRTALFNYLYAKQNNGKFILRIEDTDTDRFVPGAEQYIIDTFKWLGIEFDETPYTNSENGPYRQSERKDIYKKYVDILIANDLAYFAFDTNEELEKLRKDNSNFIYNASTRKNMKNSLTLSQNEVKDMLNHNNDWVVRIKYPETPIKIKVVDNILGEVFVDSSTLDDKVIWKKKDELPTYHLANVVDDHLMGVTDVIRGNEWLASAPLHVFLYQCFDWVAPKFSHLPLILKPFGDGKLSKRDGEMYGFPVFPLQWYDKNTNKTYLGFKESGYLPEAVINFLCFIGWNPGTNKEFYTLEELIKDFSLKKVNKTSGRFNLDKAAWFNGQHLSKKSSVELLDDFKKICFYNNINLTDDKLLLILDTYKSKVKFLTDITNSIDYVRNDFKYNHDYMLSVDSSIYQHIFNYIDRLEELNFNSTIFKEELEKIVNDNNLKFNEFVSVLRFILTGDSKGINIFTILTLLDKNVVYVLNKYKIML